MAKVIVELDSAGIRELLKSQEIASVCESEAAKMTQAAGVKYTADVHMGRTRVNARAIRRADNDRKDNS